MKLRVGEAVHEGPAVDLPATRPAAPVATALRTGEATGPDGTTVTATVTTTPPPHPLHERVAVVHPGLGLRVKTALAEAGRTRRLATPADHAIASLERRLAQAPPAVTDTRPDREAAAAAGVDVTALRERVATLRGRLQARREAGGDTEALEADLQEAVAALAEAETAASAAAQRHERAARAAREDRAARIDRLRLEDRLANRRREARATLVDRLRGAYVDALDRVPSRDSEERPTDADPFDVDPVTAALAVIRVADLDTPVVLAAGRFEQAAAARETLGTPVVRVGD